MPSKFAGGLAHAHEHGIVHRDLKPANILLTDDGEPLILDFNLSSQSSAVGSSVAMVGGTLPYMAPEHIVALSDGKAVGPTADIYSLGVILFEMLTGELPYAIRQGPFEQVAAQMLEDRRQPAPSARQRNGTVSPDLATIVGKCLELSPADRYQSASALQVDLERHLEQLPLAHAPNRSIGERAAKWCRRHPRLASTASVATVASVLIVALLLAWMGRGRIIATQVASRHADHLLESTNLEQQRDFQRVSAAQQEQLRHGSAELLYLLASGKALIGFRTAPGEKRNQLFEQALTINASASSLAEEGQPPKAMLLQRARLLEAVGRDAEASAVRGRAAAQAASLDFDRYLLATESSQNHDNRTAIELLEALLRDRPQDYATWLGLGSAYFGASHFARAEGCYTTCIALQPQRHLAYFMRGVTRIHQQSFAGAKQDFDSVLRLRPNNSAALVNRALA